MKCIDILTAQLNSAEKQTRLEALSEIVGLENNGGLTKPVRTDNVNNHIHTKYSFSPYSPSAAVYYARNAGLSTAGIMDHDSVGGCREFLKAGGIADMAVTCGFECRVHMTGTPLEAMRFNNPDQKSIAYVTLHGIPNGNIELCEEFLAPYRMHRNIRNRLMTQKINHIFKDYNISIDYERDVVPLSLSSEGGSITERHILFALSLKICDDLGKGRKIVNFLKNDLRLELSSKNEGYLGDSGNSYYEYDLLGTLKSGLVSEFYIDAADECPHVSEFIRFADKVGGISAYAYLGDVVDSVTGDKKAQKFEDGCLDELFDVITSLGFRAVTYMPSRNTLPQLKRVISLCDDHNLFQISGEDINTPRQSFICSAQCMQECRHLLESTWALIGHERAGSENIGNGMFSKQMIEKYPLVSDRVHYFANTVIRGR